MGDFTELITNKTLRLIQSIKIYQKRNKNHSDDRKVVF